MKITRRSRPHTQPTRPRKRAARCSKLRTLAVVTALGLPAMGACANPIQGDPIPAAGFYGDDPQPPTAPRASEPQIPQPRRVDGLDPCTLFAPEDFARVGGAVGPPRPGTPLPSTCSHALGGGPEDAVGAGFHLPYAEVVTRQPAGAPVAVDGHSTWLYCELVDVHQTCTASTAISQDRTLLTLLSKQGATAADTADQLFALTTSALRRLPPA
ncbi:DUF3558 domain-containing protein [Saccharopolyspora erythraea]|uniref:DUF3558 domain-containing protein n=1 Tax=Saccharopolyspora erythraea TaxID=1836 RepID=UPI0020112202|nr:DUF3558 domain-containing protein [Saccharopolyspora erythraea]